MRKTKLHEVLAAAWLAFSGGSWAAAAQSAAAAQPAARIRLAVFHTNDVHGWIMAREATFYSENPKRMIGGAAALARAIEKHKEPGQPSLLLDGGDWFQGTPEGNLSRGQAVVDVFNALGYDAVVAGNHDFDFGEARLKELVAGLKVPTLGANVVEERAPRRTVPYLKPYILKDVGGVKVGVFGLVTTNMHRLTFAKNFAGLAFESEVETARRMVKELRGRGADVVIALTHVGLENPKRAPFTGDQSIAASVPGIDLIVGGHTHDPLSEPVRDPVHGTLIVQAGSYLTRLGKAVLEIDPGTKKVVASSARLINLWVDELGEDPKMLALWWPYREEAGRVMDVVLGTAAEPLTRDRYNESTLGDWVTDCERKWTKTQIAVQNGGGLRDDIPGGPVSMRRVFQVMPFDNYVATLNLKGSLVKDVVENGVGGQIGVLQVSGLKFTYDPKAERGSRVRRLEVGGRPLDPEQTYSLTTVDFLLDGGDGFAFAQGEDKARTETLLRDVLAWCVKEYSPIRAPKLERITKQ